MQLIEVFEFKSCPFLHDIFQYSLFSATIFRNNFKFSCYVYNMFLRNVTQDLGDKLIKYFNKSLISK